MELAQYKASLSEEAERFDDMIQAVQEMISQVSTSVNPVQRSIVHTAYKSKVLSLLKSVHILEKAEAKNYRETALREAYKTRLKDLVRTTCLEIIDFIDYKFLVFETDPEGVVFLLKIKGDYFRYIAEAGFQDAADLSGQCYHKALDRVSQLPPANLTRLGLILSYSVYQHDIKKDLREATLIAKEGFDSAIKDVNGLPPDVYKEVMSLLDLLREDIKVWKTERQGSRQVGGLLAPPFSM